MFTYFGRMNAHVLRVHSIFSTLVIFKPTLSRHQFLRNLTHLTCFHVFFLQEMEQFTIAKEDILF